jgi:hypothetical protein
MAQNFTDFTLPKNSYATFDALTLKQLIKDRLNQGGIFTDQNFEGSNLNAIIDVVALSYHYLLFYLNTTSSESLFDQATLYENMNRMVKLINYSPTGYKTSLLSFEATANSSLTPNLYTIPRYSYFTINGIYYTFLNDITFSKTTVDTESLPSLYDESLLYQGKIVEYPTQIATGENFETFTVVLKNNINNTPTNIEQSSINVYIKDINTGKYNQYFVTNSLFLENSDSAKFECRYNENGFYELKFGNGVFGKKLNTNDLVYVYLLQSDGEGGVISANQLNANPINFYSTPQFNLIKADVLDQTLNYLTVTQSTYLNFTNPLASSSPSVGETVDQIRINAPKTFFSQNRLITESDFKTFIDRTYSNIVLSSSVASNRSYMENFIKYFYDLGLTRPNQDARFLLNEVNFAHAGQDNNVHLFMVPRIKSVDENNNQYFLQNSQKNTILTAMANSKALNMEIVPHDPIYTAFTLGFQAPGEELTPDIALTSYLVIKKNTDLRVDVNKIIDSVNSIFINYFAPENCTLGQLISLNDLITQILSVDGVSSFSMRRVLNDGTVYNDNGLNLLVFNPNYSDVDILIQSTDLQLPYFKFPYLYNKTILDNIIVE